MMYSADSRNSLIVADRPRLSSTGFWYLPTSVSRRKFCMLRAPIWRTSAYCATSSMSRGSTISVITGRPAKFAADELVRRQDREHALNPWKDREREVLDRPLVADHTDQPALLAGGQVRRQAALLDLLGEVLDLGLGGPRF